MASSCPSASSSPTMSLLAVALTESPSALTVCPVTLTVILLIVALSVSPVALTVSLVGGGRAYLGLDLSCGENRRGLALATSCCKCAQSRHPVLPMIAMALEEVILFESRVRASQDNTYMGSPSNATVTLPGRKCDSVVDGTAWVGLIRGDGISTLSHSQPLHLGQTMA